MTITPDERFHVSSRLRDDFHNGDAYYALEGRDLWLPTSPNDRPSKEFFVEWHDDTVLLP